MSILINLPDRDTTKLVNALSQFIDANEIQVWPNIKDKASIRFALVWNHQAGSLNDLPNLELISSFGAGVDSILADEQLPDVPVARIIDQDLAINMANYVLTMINHHRLRLPMYQQQQTMSLWKPRSSIRGKHVGILGLGQLGKFVGQFLLSAGFKVSGWSQTDKIIEGIDCSSGDEAFEKLVENVDYLVCLLPLTRSTRGIIDHRVFERLKSNAVLINVARGPHVVEQDLIAALYEKEISAAYLDVFDIEPLPEKHPYWRTPNLTITPHVSAVTNVDTAIEQVVENYQRIKDGLTPLNCIDLNKGY